MTTRVDPVGQRKGQEWRHSINSSRIRLRSLLLQIARPKVSKLPFSVRIDLCGQGILYVGFSNNSLEQAEEARAALLREKLKLENKLQNLTESDAFSHANPDHHHGLLGKKIVDLKAELAEKNDVAVAAIEKMRRAEMTAAEAQKEIAAERQSIVQLHKDKVRVRKISLTTGTTREICERSANEVGGS